MPPAPDHFSRCSEINRQGPRLVRELPALEALKPEQFRERMEDSGTLVLDTRSYTSFAGIHIPGIWHIDLGGNFPIFTGWVIPPEKDILLVADTFEDAVRAKTWASRVGIDKIVAFLEGGMSAWVTGGEKSSDIHLLSPEELHDMVSGDSNMILVDVRASLEFAGNHIEGAVNIPTADLRTRFHELDPEKPIVLICSSGNRGSLAASILKQHGFSDVGNVAGGMTGYSAAGYARECPVCVIPHGSRFF
jgi:rhodanese-related sulfurtransferase